MLYLLGQDALRYEQLLHIYLVRLHLIEVLKVFVGGFLCNYRHDISRELSCGH